MLITFPYILQWRLVNANRIPQRLRHLLHAVEPFQNRRSQYHLRFLSVSPLQFAPHLQVELLVSPAQLHVGLKRHRVISSYQRIASSCNEIGFSSESAYGTPRARAVATPCISPPAEQAHPSSWGRTSGDEIDHCLCRVENLENLRLIRLRILFDLLACQRRPRR